VEQGVPDEARLEASVVEAEVVVLLEGEEASQAAGAPQEEAREVLAQARTEELQEVQDADSVVVVEATKLMPCHYPHVAYAAFEEIPIKNLWLAISRELGVQQITVPKQAKIISIQGITSVVFILDVTCFLVHFVTNIISSKKHFSFWLIRADSGGADFGRTSSQPQTRSQEEFLFSTCQAKHIHSLQRQLPTIENFEAP
jgi:hypothetical protein